MKAITRRSLYFFAALCFLQGCQDDTEKPQSCDESIYIAECAGDTALTCVDSKVVWKDCILDSQICIDGRCVDGKRCDSSNFVKKCDGNVAISCVNDLEQKDICSQSCEEGKGCVQTHVPCNEADFVARCDGSNLVLCKEGKESSDACPNTNEACHQGACVDKSLLCSANHKNRCNADALISCEDGLLQTSACSEDGAMVCGIDADGATNCVDAQTCDINDGFSNRCLGKNVVVTCVNGFEKKSACAEDAVCMNGACIKRIPCNKADFVPTCVNGAAHQCIDGIEVKVSCEAPQVCQDGACIIDAPSCELEGFEPKCLGDKIVHCIDGYEQASDCDTGTVCGKNDENIIECVEATACDESYPASCDGRIAISCINDLVSKLACDKQSICVEGACRACTENEIVCDNVCVNTAEMHLKDCNTCTEGYGNCDNDLSNGCEANLSSTKEHCKSCNNACVDEAVCSAGTCIAQCNEPEVSCEGVCNVLADVHMNECKLCEDGYRNCDENWQNGCEVDLGAKNLQSCGLCKDGFLDCDNNPNNGCETQFDSLNMLDCTRCKSGYANCDNNLSNGCEVKLSDRNWTSCNVCRENYADCDNDATHSCETNLLSKNWSACGVCSAGFGNCNNNSSGSCDVRLSNGASAQASNACICTAGKANCDNDWTNGCEVDLNAMNWTNCSKTCKAGWIDWDKDPSNGCELKQESTTCQNGQTRVCWPYDFEPKGTYCKKGTQTCTGNEWSACVGFKGPVREATCSDLDVPFIADGQNLSLLDRDCDGFPDGCISPCEAKIEPDSYIGCEYWSVFLENLIPTNLTVIISNTGTETANVKIYKVGNVLYKSEVVPPNTSKQIPLSINPNAGSEGAYFAEMLSGSSQLPFGYRIISDNPVTAYQFNPMDKANAHTNDASLLLPANVYGRDYAHLTWAEDANLWPSYISIVAVEPGNTVVKVKAKAATNAGTQSIPSIPANGERTFTLKQYDVLTIGSNSTHYLGSQVNADKKIAAFSGRSCTRIPTNFVACDHLEEMLFPIKAWGSHFHAIKTKPRRYELDQWHILALHNGTKIQLSSPFNQTITLNAFEVYKLATSRNFEIKATYTDGGVVKPAPILVSQFIEGIARTYSNQTPAAVNATATFPAIDAIREAPIPPDPSDPHRPPPPNTHIETGDPSAILSVPVQQYRKDYSFMVPSSFDYDFITIVAPKNTVVKYDGVAIPASAFLSFGTGDYVYTYRMLKNSSTAPGGTHTISADKPVGISGYGFYQATSYGYPLGLNLKSLNTVIPQ